MAHFIVILITGLFVLVPAWAVLSALYHHCVHLCGDFVTVHFMVSDLGLLFIENSLL